MSHHTHTPHAHTTRTPHSHRTNTLPVTALHPPVPNQTWQDMYEKALLRKRLFKEYISRNQVLERFNSAIEVS